MTDVFLIHPPVSFATKHLQTDIIPDCPPLGLLYLASGVENLGFSVKVLDAVDGSLTIDDILKLIDEEKPRLVGITAMTMNIKGAIQLAKTIKENLEKDCQVCLGGPHISADPTIIQRFPFFDFGVIGEADITLPKSVRQIVHENRKFNGIIETEVPMNLDEIPFPARHLVNWEYYKKKRGFWGNAILATRGCPFGCIFCSIPSILRKHRVRSPRLVVKEMIEAYNVTGTKTFVFIDDCFTLQRDFVTKLCKEIESSGFHFQWVAQTRANLVDNELLKEMKKAGCYELIFGVESGNERIRNEVVHKRLKNEEIQKATELCWKNGIAPDWYLMLGFPTETRKELYETVNFPLKVKPHPNIIGVHITTPLPGAPIFELALDEGIIPPDVIDKFVKGDLGEGYKDVWPYYVPKGLTLEELKTARKRAYTQFYFRPEYMVKRIIHDLKSLVRLKKDIREGYALLKHGRAAEDE